MALDLNSHVESGIPDYPEKGSSFRDITPLMAVMVYISPRCQQDRIVQFA